MASETDPMVATSQNWTRLDYESHISHYLDEVLLKSLVGVTCSLSICGALFIILTFICFKEIRSTGRLLLVHLSSMDLLTAISTLTGTLITFHYHIYDQPGDSRAAWITGCEVQAGVFIFATLSSVLWTDALALYLLVFLISKKPKVARACTYVMYVICYGVPLLVVIVLGVEHDLGLDNSTAGWCAIKRPLANISEPGEAFAYSFFVGYDFWVMASFVILPVIYIIMKVYILRMKYLRRHGEATPLMSSTDSNSYDRFKMVEWKLMLVPIFFVILRVWTLALTIKYVYLQPSTTESIPTSDYWLFYVGAVADSGQGFVNGILWCGLSLAVWQRCWLAGKRCHSRVSLCCQTHCAGSSCKCVRKRSPNVSVQFASPDSSPMDSFVSNEPESDVSAVERLRY